MALGTRENDWLRQVVSYWTMAASFVLQGTLSEAAFLDPAVSGEMFAVFAKVQSFLGELRKRLGKPEFLLSVEKVIQQSSKGRARLEVMSKRISRDIHQDIKGCRPHRSDAREGFAPPPGSSSPLRGSKQHAPVRDRRSAGRHPCYPKM